MNTKYKTLYTKWHMQKLLKQTEAENFFQITLFIW